MGSHLDLSPGEKENHLAAIHILVDSLGIPDETVISVYESELERIGAGARIREFLPLVVRRIVKGVIRDRLREDGIMR
ncbi:MAG TPA: DUF3562 domain-containing protein [Candidatus Deferrimicrobiaceae bacterium]